MSPNQVLWAYIILLIIGGLIGYLKAKSKVSLIMSAAFAAALSLCAAGIVFQNYMADILLALLIVVFAIRVAKTKKIHPRRFDACDHDNCAGLASRFVQVTFEVV